MPTILVNIKTTTFDVYIGRGTPFGNPHKIGWCQICRRSHTRIDAIKAFREDFGQSLVGGRTAKLWKEQLQTLKDKVLGCHCAPQPCHGDVIVEWLDKTGQYAPKETEETITLCSCNRNHHKEP